MNILVTGGTGYIGSHTIVELLAAGHAVVVVDNLSASSQESLRRVEKLTGHVLPFQKVDLRDKSALEVVFEAYQFDAVIHFAGSKIASESIENPLLYYDNNLMSSVILFEVMAAHNVTKLVFSSSAAVYGNQEDLPVIETSAKQPTHAYGRTKLMIEQMLQDLAITNTGWNVTALRYFNPVGAHISGTIGESNSRPTNLLPYVCQVALGNFPTLSVYGNDYNTPDGTGIRDYIHVVDLAKAHVAALANLDHPNTYKAYNVGTGVGTSVLELITAFEKATNKKVACKIMPRRSEDIESSYADPSLANKELNWTAELSVRDACRDAWRWQTQNPHGFEATS